MYHEYMPPGLFMFSSFIWIALTFLGCASSTLNRNPACVSTEPMVFFNISDSHVIVPTDKNTWRLSKDGLHILQDTIERVNGENPSFVFLSGDVMEGKYHGMKNLGAAYDALTRIRAPWFVVAGNHDGKYIKKENTIDEFDKKRFFERFSGHGPTAEQGYWKKDIPHSKLTLIGLNTSIDGSSSGLVDKPQLDWLDSVLREVSDDRLVMIIAHHPLVVFNPSILDADKKVLEIFVISNHEEVRSVLERHRRKVRFVLTGHTHSPEYLEHNGIHYIGTPSINSWPNRFTRFELRDGTLSWEHIPISDEKMIAEAWRNLSSESPFKDALKSDEALRAYFTHGPMSGKVRVDCLNTLNAD